MKRTCTSSARTAVLVQHSGVVKLTAKEFQTAFDQLNVQQAFVQQTIQQQAVLHKQQETARRRAVAEELDRSWIAEVAVHSTTCEQAAANQTVLAPNRYWHQAPLQPESPRRLPASLLIHDWSRAKPLPHVPQEWFRGLPGLGDQHDMWRNFVTCSSGHHQVSAPQQRVTRQHDIADSFPYGNLQCRGAGRS
jgi:hypothetical protein